MHTAPLQSIPRPRRHLGAAAMGLLLALAALLLPLPAARALEVAYDIQPRILSLGERATLTLTLQNVRSIPRINLPAIPGLQIAGPQQSSSTRINNGHVTQSSTLVYTLFPSKAGSFPIGPFTLEANGETATLPLITLDVRAPSPDASNHEMLFARLNLPDSPPFIHQVFDLVLALYSLPSIELTQNISLAGFPESGFVFGPFEELQPTREDVDGQLYNVRRFRARARALTAGDFPLTPLMQVGVVDRSSQNSRRNGDPFGGFFDDPFFSRASATPVNVALPPATLTVRPLPPDGRPASFSGAVGNYTFTADVRPRTLTAGDPVTVTLTLQGRGNISAALPPSYTDAPLYKAYEARQAGDTPDPAAETGVKTFEQVVLPRDPALTALPPLDFTFFDPASATYRTLTVGPFPLTVQPAANGSSALLLQSPSSDSTSPAAPLLLGTDLIYLQPAPQRWLPATANAAANATNAAPAPLHRLLFPLSFLLSPLLLALLLILSRHRNRLQRDIAFARRQKAPRAARTALRRAAQALRDPSPAPASVIAPLADAARDYLAHRLNLPPRSVDSSTALARLAASPNLSPDDLAQWRTFFALADQTLYATPPPLSPADLAQWHTTLTTLLRRAERISL